MTTHANDSANIQLLNRRAAIRWTFFIVGLLLFNLSLVAIGVVEAIRTDPPVVKDYYNKAVNWDERHKFPAATAPSHDVP